MSRARDRGECLKLAKTVVILSNLRSARVGVFDGHKVRSKESSRALINNPFITT